MIKRSVLLVVFSCAMFLLGGALLLRSIHSHSSREGNSTTASKSAMNDGSIRSSPISGRGTAEIETPKPHSVDQNTRITEIIASLSHLVDVEGADFSYLLAAASKEMDFIRDNASRFSPDILEQLESVCIERGGYADPLTTALGSCLPKAIQEQLRQKLTPICAPGITGPARLPALMSIISDSSQAIGLRHLALKELLSTEGTLFSDRLTTIFLTVQGLPVSSLRTRLEATLLPNLLLRSDSSDRTLSFVIDKALECASDELETKGTRGGAIEAFSALVSSHSHDAIRNQYQPRVERYLLGTIIKQSEMKEPDQPALSLTLHCLLQRSPLSGTSYIEDAQGLLKGDHDDSVRACALAYIAPFGLIDMVTPEALAYRHRVLTLQLDCLRSEHSVQFSRDLIYSLTRHGSSHLIGQLREIQKLRPELDVELETAIKTLGESR